MKDNEEYISIDIKRILKSLKDNILVLLIAIVLCAGIGYGSTLKEKPTYTASAQMIVMNKSNDSISDEMTDSDISASNALAQITCNLLMSNDMLESIIKECSFDGSISDLSSKVNISTIGSTQLIQIVVTDYDPERALNICREIVKLAPEKYDEAIGIGSVTEVSSPYTSGVPKSVNKTKKMLAGSFVGFVIAMLFIAVKSVIAKKQ